jgi:hypothetical protein
MTRHWVTLSSQTVSITNRHLVLVSHIEQFLMTVSIKEEKVGLRHEHDTVLIFYISL